MKIYLILIMIFFVIACNTDNLVENSFIHPPEKYKLKFEDSAKQAQHIEFKPSLNQDDFVKLNDGIGTTAIIGIGEFLINVNDFHNKVQDGKSDVDFSLHDTLTLSKIISNDYLFEKFKHVYNISDEYVGFTQTKISLNITFDFSAKTSIVKILYDRYTQDAAEHSSLIKRSNTNFLVEMKTVSFSENDDYFSIDYVSNNFHNKIDSIYYEYAYWTLLGNEQNSYVQEYESMSVTNNEYIKIKIY